MNIRASYDMTVKIKDEASGKEETYFLVRAEEENWKEAKISPYGPIGSAVFSKTVGNTVEAFFHDGTSRRFKILEIEPT